ncbi:hypothetical protein A0J61_09697 [Choanephora cucurbitarum]|uniref:Uncharacterized protein n=1 Tax=Choanephora cucurbitarum TaxID=101091 RepID=A0A1C7MZG7_9FUNG|nr:hypothetical protein A0J61_09697 [Choanephora cucurbitarum]
MYKYECHYTKTSSYKALDGIRSLLKSKSNTCHFLDLPVELTSHIFVYAQNPALATTCTYFWHLSQSAILRANYLLFHYGPSSVLGERAMQRKIVTNEVIHHLLKSKQADPKANGDDWLFLHACGTDQVDLCRAILEAVPHDAPTLTHMLNLAALKGSIRVVDLLSPYRNPNQDDTVLAIACRENHVDLVKHLVDHYGCSLHDQSERHLRNACLYGYHQLVRFILASGQTDVHAYQDAAIQNAAYKGFPLIVKMLLDAGASPDVNQNACIQYAIINHDLETLDYLIEAGVDPRVDNDWLLRHACRRGLDEIVVYLLDRITDGPDIQEGMPLEEALMHGRVSVLEILLRRGADPNSRKAIRGLRYLMNPKSKTQNKDMMIRMLVEFGLEPTQQLCQHSIPIQSDSKANFFSTLLSWI